MVRHPEDFLRASPINTVFSWEDVVADVGYNVFYGMRNTEGDSLTTNTIASNSWRTSRTASGTTEFNLDHEFLAAATIEGTGFCVGTVEIIGMAAASPSGVTISIRLLKVVSAVETELVSTLTSSGVSGTAGSASRRFTVQMTIPNTYFSIGDKLRLEVILNFTKGSGTPTGSIYHDPANRGTISNDTETGDAPNTDLQLIIPFKIQQ